MMINTTVQSVAGVYASTGTTSAAKAKAELAETVEGKDEILLSNEAQNFSSTLQKLKDMDTVRQDKVTFYENQLAAGNYKAGATDIAGKMLQLRY